MPSASTSGRSNTTPKTGCRWTSCSTTNDANLGSLQAMASAADAREGTAGGHSTAVTGYVRKLGAALGLAQADVDVLEVAALLHDVGKIGIPERILSKPGPLTHAEWEIVRAHPVIGELMIKFSQFDPRLVRGFVDLMEKRLSERDQKLEALDTVLASLPKPAINKDADQDDNRTDNRDVEGAHDLA